MLSRLIEMVSFILAQSLERDDEDWSSLRLEVHEHLQGQGFNGHEIDIAFEVANKIRSRIEDGTSLPTPLKTNMVYHYLEQIKLSREARGYLFGLQQKKMLSHDQREEVVERAFFLDMPEVGLSEVQYLVNLVVGGDAWPGEDSPSMSYSIQ